MQKASFSPFKVMPCLSPTITYKGEKRLWITAHALEVSSIVLHYITNGVSRLQTNKYNSTCWPSCHGHALPPSWWKACNPARNGGAHDHHGFYHGVVL